MLDDVDGVSARKGKQEFAGAMGLFVSHASCGFIHKQETGLLGEQHAYFKPLFLAMGQGSCLAVRVGAELDGLQEAGDPVLLVPGDVAEEAVPDDALPRVQRTGNGVWVRLDPTPISDDVDASLLRVSLWTRANQAVDYCQVLWDDYVLGLNSTRQEQAVYRPLRKSVMSLFSRDAWLERGKSLSRFGHAIMTGEWITWPTGLFLTLLGLAVYLFRKNLYDGIVFVRHRLSVGARRRRRSNAAFALWDELEQIFSRSGVHRPPEQTSLEFAQLASRRLTESAETFPLAHVPNQIANAFYRVRFGGLRVSESESAQLQIRLDELENVLRGKKWDANGDSPKNAKRRNIRSDDTDHGFSNRRSVDSSSPIA